MPSPVRHELHSMTYTGRTEGSSRWMPEPFDIKTEVTIDRGIVGGEQPPGGW